MCYDSTRNTVRLKYNSCCSHSVRFCSSKSPKNILWPSSSKPVCSECGGCGWKCMHSRNHTTYAPDARSTCVQRYMCGAVHRSGFMYNKCCSRNIRNQTFYWPWQRPADDTDHVRYSLCRDDALWPCSWTTTLWWYIAATRLCTEKTYARCCWCWLGTLHIDRICTLGHDGAIARALTENAPREHGTTAHARQSHVISCANIRSRLYI